MTYGINPQEQPAYGTNPPPGKQKKPPHKRWWFWPVMALAIGLVYVINFDPPGTTETATPAPIVTETVTAAPNTNADTQANKNVPREWESALNRGNRIAARDNSKQYVYRTLTSDVYGFPEDAAQYAVDNLDVDWKENALNSARRLQARDHSRESIRRTLTSAVYGFTDEEAEYALTHLEE